MKHLFIINPAAGKYDRTREFHQEIQAVFGALGLDYDIMISGRKGDCRRIAREAALTGEDLRIYACGGDGTLNEVVSGVAGFSNVAVTHYAGGSGNDFIKIFNHPEAFRDLSRFLNCQESTFDLISCNGNFALNICSVGLDAQIGTHIAQYKRLPLVSGSEAYLLSTLVNVIKGIGHHYTVTIDGETIDDDFTLVCAANGRYYGGGFNPVPNADPQDGLLDVLLVKKVSRLQVATTIGTYKSGNYESRPDLIRHLRTKSLTITSEQEAAINLDGELDRGRVIHMAIAPEKLRFFYPSGLIF